MTVPLLPLTPRSQTSITVCSAIKLRLRICKKPRVFTLFPSCSCMSLHISSQTAPFTALERSQAVERVLAVQSIRRGKRYPYGRAALL